MDMRLILMLSLLISNSAAHAFDRVRCDGALSTWTIRNGATPSKIVLDSKNPSVELGERESGVLVVQDASGKTLAKVLPWNGIDLLPEPGVKLEYHGDNSSWFELKDKKNSLSCYLTF